MKVARLVGLALVAILAVGAMAASSALASPEFTILPTHPGFTSVAEGASVLRGATTSITCANSFTNGEVTSMDTIGKVAVKYTGCVITKGTCTTKVNSLTGKTGEIVTNPIKGLLGTVKTSEAPSGVGLLFEPESGKRFVTFTANACSPEATTNGNVAGEVTPIKKSQPTDKIVLTGSGASQEIKEIVVLGKPVKPELEAFGGESSETASDLDTFSSNVEVS